ncbi:double zinc ribbon domain-containing protein [Halobellus captivus]|uniref:double zinc ribbon domain-containing protein n=1 Tax=Halobellus captivus TaxID=2592614 RepID=UPI0011A76988|nr:zinc ribbon domain-containing protein [Halobellus captivus]
MSKITFRADDDLVERLEALETSKSEAMREALRTYLDGVDRDTDVAEPRSGKRNDVVTVHDGSGSVDDVIRERVDELVAERVDEAFAGRLPRRDRTRDLNVNVTVDGARTVESDAPAESSAVRTDHSAGESERKTSSDDDVRDVGSKACEKCGEHVDTDHVYCPNCGEKASHRVFCECGDELRSDWAFCPGCGRRTSAADVLERT